ncbi:MAG: AAA family ATPase [Nanoarchaeota archaeon]|nr:AAA family ATPase [Nanoarchaeota archaeon]
MAKVIGITGFQGSGKGVFKNFLKDLTGFPTFSLSDILREELRSQGFEITRKMLIKLGNKLRAEHGGGVLAERIVQNNNPPFIIDAINNPAEVQVLRKVFGNDFTLINLRASAKTRFERIKRRNRECDLKDWDGFVKLTKIHKGEGQGSSGQLINLCEELADLVIRNDASLDALKSKVEALVIFLQ